MCINFHINELADAAGNAHYQCIQCIGQQQCFWKANCIISCTMQLNLMPGILTQLRIIKQKINRHETIDQSCHF